jgi:hypothetical protein
MKRDLTVLKIVSINVTIFDPVPNIQVVTNKFKLLKSSCIVTSNLWAAFIGPPTDTFMEN